MPRNYLLIESIEDINAKQMSESLYPCKLNWSKQSEKISASAIQKLLEHSGYYVIGVDEAGRGPVAGPVTAGACLLISNSTLADELGIIVDEAAVIELESRLDDSKKLSEKARESLFPEVKNLCVAFGIAEASAREVDEYNILNATFLAMRRSILQVIKKMESKNLSPKPILLLVDGNQNIRLLEELKNESPFAEKCGLFQCPIIQGDGWVSCISAASILAKQDRDYKMIELSQTYPEYALEKNKGYPSPTHIEAIISNGRSEIHRQSFHIKAVDELDLFV